MTEQETKEYMDRVNDLDLDPVTNAGCQLMVMAVHYIEKAGQPPREALETLLKDAAAGEWKFELPSVGEQETDEQ